MRDHPEQVAVLSRESELTYSELSRVTAGIGAALRARGASRDKPIAVYAEPSVSGIAAIVGAVLAGFAYLPVCPSLPRTRVAAQLETAGVEYVIVCGKTLAPLGLHDVVELAVDAGTAEFSGEPGHGAGNVGESLIDPEDPVSVIFTSGSTGTPKGAVVPHRALANRIVWGQQEYPLSPGDRILQHTRYIYDFSAWEIFAALGNGATLVTGPFRHYPDFGELIGVVDEFGVTVAHFVPSVLSGFVKYTGTSLPDSLRLLFSGGESLNRSLAEQVAEMSSAILFNQYGPTETCVDSTFHRYSPTGSGQGLSVPIGEAIAATRTYVLDECLDPATSGELYVGGAGVAHGYIGRAALTAERFLPDPWGESGARMYRTGDLVTRVDSVGLVFVGRIDRQVNVRGVRVELAEVETAMAACPGVSRAVATMTTGDRPHLVAVAEPAHRSVVDGEEVRTFVRGVLPAAFVPDRIFVKDQLPRLATGKIDMAAAARLATELDQVREAEARASVAEEPADGLLAAVLAIWQRFFDAQTIPADADFFDIGGHSLLAVEVVSAVNEELDADIDLAEFFELPTPRSMENLVKGTSRWRSTAH
ncbi:non-ribosomal peptide synthetase [Streptosporangium algeriense]|uniref:Non-ribosomal peptide synthetase n=1 Tax=Streptosporangium algeriense TaxID=1682748 RepID=A0ABW3DKN7_9ACTN